MIVFSFVLAVFAAITTVHASPLAVTSTSQTAPASPIIISCGGLPVCDCTGTYYGTSKETRGYLCGDKRLGPVNLPQDNGMLGSLSVYGRLGGLSPGTFLSRWWNETNRSWNWPPGNGFLLDGNNQPILANITVEKGTLLDRFGGPWGEYLAAFEAPFSQRSIPPNYLDPENYPYHVYRVLRPMTMRAGLIAPWFGQSGLGSQFWTKDLGNMDKLKEQGYIDEPANLQKVNDGCN